jgi:signal-transduction protein with cAMP-binding, CBS, and nucleotidyltransferase domain
MAHPERRCPSCSEVNLPGADHCRHCGTDLHGLDRPESREGFRGRLSTDRMDSLPSAPCLTVTPSVTAADALSVMRENRHGAVLVRDDDGTLLGIFTERDVLRRLVRPGIDPASVRVGEVMTPHPPLVHADDPPAFAIHLMAVRGKRHVPILDGGEPVAIASARSILRYLRDAVIDT